MVKTSYSNRSDGHTVALLAIGWIVAEPGRSERFLGLTGLDSAQLRDGLCDAAVLGAAIDFLLTHEPDLIACSEAIGETPETIVAARQEIG
ncbi:MAG TPA: DUF3572 domain-containing protein [Sphingobium sp.]